MLLRAMGTRTFSGDARRLIVGLNSLKKSWKNHWLLSNTLRLARPSCLSSAVRKPCRTLRFCSFSVNCGAPAPGCVDSPGSLFQSASWTSSHAFPGSVFGVAQKKACAGDDDLSVSLQALVPPLCCSTSGESELFLSLTQPTYLHSHNNIRPRHSVGKLAPKTFLH